MEVKEPLLRLPDKPIRSRAGELLLEGVLLSPVDGEGLFKLLPCPAVDEEDGDRVKA